MRITVNQGIYLSALLHDIGKFWQRASDSRKILSQQTLQMEGSICPTGKSGYATHIHALFTSEFFEKYSHVIPQEFDHLGKMVQTGNLSARHHKPNLNELERIIQYADNLSSGHDRRYEEDDPTSDTNYKFKKVPLLNPFDTVFSVTSGKERSYFPLVPMSCDRDVFASKDIRTDDSKQQDYAKLWEDFCDEFSKVSVTDFSAQATTILYLLKKYTWCMPSATNAMPDISLYDHLKTTVAIASCLYDSHDPDLHVPLPESFYGLEKEESRKRFVLVAGDFSGIQKFIYQLSSKGAAKTLKGRSFFLNLIQDTVIQKCKSLFSVEDAHILMHSGGRFQILLPNDEKKLARFFEYVGQVNKQLRDDYDQALYLALGTYAFPAKRLLDQNGYSDIVKQAYKQVERDKSRRFAKVIDKDFFKPQPVSGTKAAQVCHVTGMDLQDHQTENLGDEENTVISKKVHEQIQLGRWLRNVRYMVKVRKNNVQQRNKEIAPLDGSFAKEKDGLIVYRFFDDTEEDRKKLKQTLQHDKVLQVVSWNDTDFCEYSEKNVSFSSVFQFYGAAWTPDDKDGRPVEFTDIANDEKNELLAVLRLDVDNLGELFRSGFTSKSDEADAKYLGSISRFSNLSEKLELFFSGYLHHLFSKELREKSVFDPTFVSQTFSNDDPRQHILPVYAGGDDVFIICRWDMAPIIAELIYERFKSFANYRSEISLSGGVSVVHDKYPVHKAAKESEGAEKKAKSLPEDGKPDGKDAFCLFDQAMSWQDFRKAKEYIAQIISWQKKMGKRTLLGFLRNLHYEYEHSRQFGSWRWRSAYRLKRIGSACNNEEDMVALGSWLFTGRYHGYNFERLEKMKTKTSERDRPPELVDLTGLAVRWMQSLTRNKS